MAEGEIERVLLTEEQIRERVGALAAEISRECEGRAITALGVLTGAFVFLADLLRRLECPAEVGFVRAESYRDGTRPGALDVEIVGAPALRGRDVLVVEDILDTGRSLAGILEAVRGEGPRSLRTVVLLDKRERREVEVDVDHVGFTVPDEFLVGYGLDHAQRFRHLPYVGVLARSAYERD
jgi:hypoxanthine phosphoribosyltransferase